jgi:transposase
LTPDLANWQAARQLYAAFACTALAARPFQGTSAERNTEHGSGLGVFRWVVERTLAWLHQFRRLRTRYDRRDDIHEAFMSLGCAMICWNYLN